MRGSPPSPLPPSAAPSSLLQSSLRLSTFPPASPRSLFSLPPSYPSTFEPSTFGKAEMIVGQSVSRSHLSSALCTTSSSGSDPTPPNLPTPTFVLRSTNPPLQDIRRSLISHFPACSFFPLAHSSFSLLTCFERSRSLIYRPFSSHLPTLPFFASSSACSPMRARLSSFSLFFPSPLIVMVISQLPAKPFTSVQSNLVQPRLHSSLVLSCSLD